MYVRSGSTSLSRSPPRPSLQSINRLSSLLLLLLRFISVMSSSAVFPSSSKAYTSTSDQERQRADKTSSILFGVKYINKGLSIMKQSKRERAFPLTILVSTRAHTYMHGHTNPSTLPLLKVNPCFRCQCQRHRFTCLLACSIVRSFDRSLISATVHMGPSTCV